MPLIKQYWFCLVNYIMDCQVERSNDGSLIRILFKNRLDRIVPFAMELLKQFFGRCNAPCNRFFQWSQIARLVAAITIEPLAPRQPPCTEPPRFVCQGK